MANKQQTSIEELYKNYKDPVYNYLYRLCMDPHLAQDITQLTFLKAIGDPNSASLEHPKAYLYTIARNALMDEWKKKKPTALPDTDIDIEDTSLAAQPQTLTEDDDMRQKLEVIIGSMPSKQRELMLLRYREDMSHPEIAEVTGYSVSDVKVSLHRARIKFEQNLTQQMYARIAKTRKKCDELERILQSFGGGDLSLEQLKVVEKHIATCPICLEDAETLKRHRQLFALIPLVLAPAILDDLFKPAMAGTLSAFSPAHDSAANAPTNTNAGTNVSEPSLTSATQMPAGAGLDVGDNIKRGLFSLLTGKAVAAAVVVAAISGGGGYLAGKQSSTGDDKRLTKAAVSQQYVVADKSAIELTAQLVPGVAATNNIKWTIYDAQNREVGSSRKAQETMTLAPGDYRVVLTADQARAETPVNVQKDKVVKVALSLQAANLKLGARVAANAALLDKPISWNILAPEPDINGEYKQLSFKQRAAPIFTLPAGKYRVEASYGRQPKKVAVQEVTVQAGQNVIAQDFSFDAGYLQLGAHLPGETALLDKHMRWSVYAIHADASVGAEEIAYSERAQPQFTLPAGRYKVIAQHGKSNSFRAQASQEVDINAGETIALKDIEINAAYLKLAARLRKDMPVLDEKLYWTVYAAEADEFGQYKEIGSTGLDQPLLILPAGRYRVRGQYDRHAATVQDITVQAGDQATVSDFIIDAGYLALGARPTVNGALLDKDVYWTIKQAEANVYGKHEEIASTGLDKPIIILPSGRYLVQARYGENSMVEQEVAVQAGEKTTVQNFVMNAGYLFLEATLPGAEQPLTNDVYWSISAGQADKFGQYKSIKQIGLAKPKLTLQAGQYRIEAQYKQQRVVQNVSVTADQVTRQTLLIE